MPARVRVRALAMACRPHEQRHSGRAVTRPARALQIKIQHVLKTLLETAYAMRHLHNMHILHRDLKIQNILLKSSNKDSRGFTVKVSDFGLAKIWDGRGRGNSPSEKQKYAGAWRLCARL